MRNAIRLVTLILPLAGLLGLPHVADARPAQVGPSRTDYLGFRCNWPNDDYSVSCRHKRFSQKQINFYSD